jgi:5-formyltetrahydrofolate cyclo-ligase
MRRVQLVVCGSVAVNRTGAGRGKGAGYSYVEVALLTDAGVIGPSTMIVTTVHPLQVLDGPLPETGHDSRIDLIITPGEVIACGTHRRPNGLDRRWAAVTADALIAATLSSAGPR